MGNWTSTGKGSSGKTTLGCCTAGRPGQGAGWNLLRACESRKQVRDGGDTPSCNVGSTVVCRESHACRPARRVHARQSGAHFAGLLGPRHPRRPRPRHRPCGTFFRQQTCHPRRPVPPKFLGPRAPRPFCAFPQVVSQDGEKSAKTSAPPQRSVRAGTAGDIRNMAGPVDEVCPLVLASLARAGCAGAHSTVPMPFPGRH